VIRLTVVRIAGDEDVVAARQRARQVAAALGFDPPVQTRLATAVAEIARNAATYAGGGSVTFTVNRKAATLDITISDRGPGMSQLQAVLEGTYRSSTGTGMGILGARRLVDGFEIESTPARGTLVRLRQKLPSRRGSPAQLDFSQLAERLAREKPRPPVEEIQEQNRELLAVFDDLRRRQEDLALVTGQLLNADRAVQAAAAELEEKTDQLQRAEAIKAKFLSNVAHEFQTPLNSIGALSRMLLDETSAALTSEQKTQVEFIRQATRDLSNLVTDLLDLAKVDAGKATLHPSRFTIPELFGVLRGLLRPLQTSDLVALEFAASDDLPPLFTDEGKVSQILRNYISNALKFTERGEVRVTAERDGEHAVLFRVRDTGIGIPVEEQGLLFQEFNQLPNRLQARVRGTGLGLSLCKRLAEVLGGSVGAESEPGAGSTFWARLPLVAPGHELPPDVSSAAQPAADGPVVLVIDDDDAARYVLRHALTSAGCRVIEATGGQEGVARALNDRPDAILLDLHMPDMPGTEALARLKRNTATSHIPVVICTSQVVDPRERQRLSMHVAAVLSKARLGESDGQEDVRQAFRMAHIHLQSR
jgi:signal transduction histidine kinase